MEAIQRTGAGGSIIWDYEPVMLELAGVWKLCIIDTGDGMTGDEMVRFINQLSSSMSEQSLRGNYGVGAKIAAATRNPGGGVVLLLEKWPGLDDPTLSRRSDWAVWAETVGARRQVLGALPSDRR